MVEVERLCDWESAAFDVERSIAVELPDGLLRRLAADTKIVLLLNALLLSKEFADIVLCHGNWVVAFETMRGEVRLLGSLRGNPTFVILSPAKS